MIFSTLKEWYEYLGLHRNSLINLRNRGMPNPVSDPVAARDWVFNAPSEELEQYSQGRLLHLFDEKLNEIRVYLGQEVQSDELDPDNPLYDIGSSLGMRKNGISIAQNEPAKMKALLESYNKLLDIKEREDNIKSAEWIQALITEIGNKAMKLDEETAQILLAEHGIPHHEALAVLQERGRKLDQVINIFLDKNA